MHRRRLFDSTHAARHRSDRGRSDAVQDLELGRQRRDTLAIFEPAPEGLAVYLGRCRLSRDAPRIRTCSRCRIPRAFVGYRCFRSRDVRVSRGRGADSNPQRRRRGVSTPEIERSGCSSWSIATSYYVHKELELDDVERRYPADHYVMVDDKLWLLDAIKRHWGPRVTTVWPRQGHYVTDARVPALPPPDVTLSRIGELLAWDLPRCAARR